MNAKRVGSPLRPNVQAPRKGTLVIAAIWSIGIATGSVLVAAVLFAQRHRATVVVPMNEPVSPGSPIVRWKLDADGRDEFGRTSLEALPANDGGGPVFDAGAARFGCATPYCTGPGLRASTSNSSLRLGHEFTISAWVRVDGTSHGDFGMIFTNGQVELYTTHRGEVVAALYDTHGIPSALLSSRRSIGDGRWHHVAVSRRGSSYRLWVDGTNMVGDGFRSLGPPRPTAYVGRNVVHSSWPGLIDDVTIWGRELSSRELELLTR